MKTEMNFGCYCVLSTNNGGSFVRNIMGAKSKSGTFETSIYKSKNFRCFSVLLIMCLVVFCYTLQYTNYNILVVTVFRPKENGTVIRDMISYIDHFNWSTLALSGLESTGSPPPTSSVPLGFGAVTTMRSESPGQNTSLIDVSSTSTQRDNNKKILWFNKPSWMTEHILEKTLQNCEYRNCHTSTDMKLFDTAAAVIFTISSGLGNQPPVTPDKRNPDQAWVFFTLEAPSYYGGLGQPYFAEGWASTMNWSMTYMHDADIFFPYGTLERRSDAYSRNYSAIYKNKTKLVAWFVSNCRTPGRREDYVQELKNASLEIDIYGGCSQEGLHLPRFQSDDINQTLSHYFFYFSFENSICEDYVTEKLFAHYNYDVIQVVRGGADYKRLLPENSYIDSANFDSPAKMVEYLKTLAGNKTKYVEMLAKKHSVQCNGILAEDDKSYKTPVKRQQHGYPVYGE
ncbi:4-galactosyl-N-acetylglucosaminide 3-alpha-L-fucosyltransferase FUT6-like isoform X2 [Dreissena polymorpha]|uniref:4-galactosyl-N-acetylglucosaminide 3-alpha-L-fucosyltransferase FUT6-like isoform X2 n=1 Tax=Dreissena polymorpha TaxID=45954 RepID=UPI002263B7BB|nr:4-galactosyl-N-acetylglucosaminide 3-alpha-L-fucosyltransferase FUT6-like isoform X2 [Dreissena polymorpha]